VRKPPDLDCYLEKKEGPSKHHQGERMTLGNGAGRAMEKGEELVPSKHSWADLGNRAGK